MLAPDPQDQGPRTDDPDYTKSSIVDVDSMFVLIIKKVTSKIMKLQSRFSKMVFTSRSNPPIICLKDLFLKNRRFPWGAAGEDLGIDNMTFPRFDPILLRCFVSGNSMV